MPHYEVRFDSIAAFDTVLEHTGAVFRLGILDAPNATIVFNGTGLTYDGNNLPTGGTITSISLLVFDGVTDVVMQTLTGINVTASQIGDFIRDAFFTVREDITWLGVIGEDAEPVIISPTQIRLLNANGTFTDIIGSGFDAETPGAPLGTVTAIRHIAADGTTVLSDVPVSTTLLIALSGLFEVIAGNAIYILFNQGANTLTGVNPPVIVGLDTYSSALIAGYGDDTIDIGPISSLDYEYAISSVTVNLITGTASGGLGADTINGTVQLLQGSYFDDTLIGDSGGNELDGRAGNDTLIGNDGTDVLEGRDGDDTLNGGAGIDTILYNDDEMSAGVVVSLAIATAQNTIGAGIDTITGVENIIGSAFADTLTGNASANQLEGGFGGDALNGGDGDDTLRGDAGNDTLDGGNNNDTLFGGDNADTLYGRAGNDTLDGGTGSNTLEGGGGDDTYIVRGASDVVVELAASGTDTIVSTATRTLGNFQENLTLTGVAAINGFGNTLANTMIGNDAANTLNGLAGADALSGGLGADTLNGGDGTDTLNGGGDGDVLDGGNDADTLNGGDGADTLYGRTQNDALNGEAGNDTIFGGDGDDVATGGDGDDLIDGLNNNDALSGGDGADDLYGRQNNDVLNGDAGNDELYGGDGDDQLNGGANDDLLDGGNGVDVLNGGDGADTLYGRNGNDTLDGGLGADTLSGGNDPDTFVFSTALGAGNVDTIQFYSAAQDTIQLDVDVFSTIGLGTLAANAFVIGPAATTADHRIIYDATTGALYYDADGDGAGAAVQFAALGTGLALTNADFVGGP